MSTTGTFDFIIVAKNANGITANEVPTMNTKSAFYIISGASLNFEGNCSPKNTISGFINPSQFFYVHFGIYSFYTANFQASIEAAFLQTIQ